MKGLAFRRRIGFALHGIVIAFNRERSFRTQCLAGAVILVILLLVRPAPLWWAVGALTVGLVLVAELVNTALETLVDHLHPERHPAIGAAKDIAAGAVLLASSIAVLVAVAFMFAHF